MPRVSKKKIENAIEGSGGIISTVAQRAKTTRQTVYSYMKKYPCLQTKLNEEKEKILDMAESKLMTLIGKEDRNAIQYYLDRMGKGRGYGDKKEFDHNVQGESNFTANILTPEQIAVEVMKLTGRSAEITPTEEKSNETDT